MASCQFHPSKPLVLLGGIFPPPAEKSWVNFVTQLCHYEFRWSTPQWVQNYKLTVLRCCSREPWRGNNQSQVSLFIVIPSTTNSHCEANPENSFSSFESYREYSVLQVVLYCSGVPMYFFNLVSYSTLMRRELDFFAQLLPLSPL